MIEMNYYQRLSDIVHNSKSFDELWGYLSLIKYLPAHTYFHSFLMYSQYDLEDIIDDFDKRTAKVVLNCINPEINVFEVVPLDKEISNNFIIIIPFNGLDDIYQILMISDSGFSELIEKEVIRRLYPKSIPTFLKQNELIKALRDFSKKFHSFRLVQVTDLSTKGKYVSPLEEQFIYTNRSWKKVTFNQAISEINEKDEWISSIRLEWVDVKEKFSQYTKVAECRINKLGEISYLGNIGDFNNHLVFSLAVSVQKRLETLKHRGLRERKFEPSPPLEILYSSEIFNNVSEIRRFGNIISNYPDSSIAVLHANPYYHASIADYIDGSSFNIWILSPSRILLKPQIKASPEGLG